MDLVDDWSDDAPFEGGEMLLFDESRKRIYEASNRRGILFDGRFQDCPHAVRTLRSGVRMVIIAYCNGPILRYCRALRKLRAANWQQGPPPQLPPPQLPPQHAAAFVDWLADMVVGNLAVVLAGKVENITAAGTSVNIAFDPETHLLRMLREEMPVPPLLATLVPLAYICTHFNIDLVTSFVSSFKPDSFLKELRVLVQEAKAAQKPVGTGRFTTCQTSEEMLGVIKQLARCDWNFNVTIEQWVQNAATTIANLGSFGAMVIARQLRLYDAFGVDTPVKIAKGAKKALVRRGGVGDDQPSLQAKVAELATSLPAAVRIKAQALDPHTREHVVRVAGQMRMAKHDVENILCEAYRRQRKLDKDKLEATASTRRVQGRPIAL
jgi:hypothetical protein